MRLQMTVSFGGGKRVDASLGEHVIHTDQHPSAGGEGSAPEPYSLFLAAIGTCAGVYVLGFCQSRGIATEGIALTQTMDFDEKTHALTGVRLEIRLPPGFPDKYVDAVRRAADLCAVKRAILQPPAFEVVARKG